MKSLIAQAAVFFCLSITANAKYAPDVKFGKIDRQDVETLTFDTDPSAEAVILHDQGNSSFIYSQATGFDVRFERFTRLKILTKDGYNWANFEIPLYTANGQKEAIQKINGFTYNIVNGEIEKQKLEKTSVFYEELSENWTIVKVAFPGVKEGSVIDLQYIISSPYASQLRSWEFQDKIPVVWSEYTVKIPEYYNYLKFTYGYHEFEVFEETAENFNINLSYTERSGTYTVQSKAKNESVNLVNYVTKFAARDIPAFKGEDFIARPDDYFLKVEYQLASIRWPNEPVQDVLGSWTQVEARLLEHDGSGQYITRRSQYRTTAEALLATATTEEEKALAAANFLYESVKWDGKSRMLASGSDKLLEDKSGSSATINLFYIGLLKEMGVAAYPVIISTRSNGKVHPVHPLVDKYNYVIAQVVIDGRELLVDLTDPYIPFGLLPERCLNELGRRIDKDNPGWVEIKVPVLSTQFYTVKMKLEEGEMKAEVQRKAEGYYALESKKTLDSKGREEYSKELAAKTENWAVSEVNVVADEVKVFVEDFKVSAEPPGGSDADFLYIDTMPFLKVEENPFKQEERMYPIDFRFPTKNVAMTQITIPEGYQIEELPQQKTFVLPDRGGLFTYSVTAADNVINVYSRFDMNKSLYLPDQYPFIKAAYDQVIGAHSQQIVLKKL